MITFCYLSLTHGEALKAVSLATFFFVSYDILRQSIPAMNDFALSVLGPFMRENEKCGWAGTTSLLLGVFTLIFFFPRDVVVVALLFLAIADPVASYVGIRFGKDKLIGNKSLQGTLAAFVTCTLLAGGYFFIKNMMLERLLIVSLLSGLIGAVSELVPIGRLDDNFTFPLLSASLLWLLISLFGGL
jgi:dolichol kinase